MSVFGRIQENAAELTPVEQKLVQVVLDRPRNAALNSGQELARAAGVHEASVSRLVRKLGFRNFGAFRSALQNEFIVRQEPASRIEKTLARSSGSSLLSDLIGREVAALNNIETYIDTQRIRDIARQLSTASRIHVFARGNAEPLANLLHRRLRRFGLDARQLSGDMRDLAEQAINIRKGDVVFAFAFRGPPKGYGALLEMAREAGARSIVISGQNGPMLLPQPDELIAVSRGGEQDEFQTLTVPMLVCNAIVLALGAIHKEKSLATLDRLGSVIKKFEGGDP